MRLAYVLGWKREDGTKIPETAAGLKEHKALVAKYQQETDRAGGVVRPAYLAVIARKHAKVATKLAEREVGRKKSKARAGVEKGRAAFAKRIHKWIDTGGSKIPSTPEGIEQHKALVARYERAYGASSATDRKARARMYKAITDSIEREKTRRVQQAQRSKVVAAAKKKADAALRAKNRAAKKKRDAKRAKAGEAQDRRRRQKMASYYRARIRLSERRIAQGKKNLDAANSALLRLNLGHPAWSISLKAYDRAKELLAKFKTNLAAYETKLAALQL